MLHCTTLLEVSFTAKRVENDLAEKLFDELRETNPYNLDFVDTQALLLYVQQQPEKLCRLAQVVAKVDLYRPESCCVLGTFAVIISGNYYSYRQEHEKAVIQFKRALQLDPNYNVAWTLIGHELVDMRNWHGAIEAYRRAIGSLISLKIDTSPRDYRAWYGLGQAYEMLRMYNYAMLYYQRAVTLRPYDSRLWCTIGDCYRRQERVQEAIRSYKRALVSSGEKLPSENAPDGGGMEEGGGDGGWGWQALYSLGEIYESEEMSEHAAWYYEKLVRYKLADGVGEDDHLGKACLFLSNYEEQLKNIRKSEEYAQLALEYATQVASFTNFAVE